MGLLSASHACMQATQRADQAKASPGEAGPTCVYAVQSSIGGRVPEADAAISCSTTRCKQAVLVRRPCNGLHSCIVIAELDDRRCGVQVPDVQLVVIAAAGNLSVIRRPFQATHLESCSAYESKTMCVTQHCFHAWSRLCRNTQLCDVVTIDARSQLHTIY